MIEIDTSKAGREFDAWIAREIFELDVVGELRCRNYDGSGWAIETYWPGTERDRYPIRPIYVAHCVCDLDDLDDLPMFGHFWGCLEIVKWYSSDIAAAWTVDRPGWMWCFNEAPHGLQATLYPSRKLYDARPYDFETIPDGIVSVVVSWDVGSKAEVYALGRCQAAYQVLTGPTSPGHSSQSGP